MVILPGTKKDWVSMEAAVMAVERAVQETKKQVLELASQMIRTASLTPDRQADPSYIVARKELADMLLFVSNGEIDLRLVEAIENDRRKDSE